MGAVDCVAVDLVVEVASLVVAFPLSSINFLFFVPRQSTSLRAQIPSYSSFFPYFPFSFCAFFSACMAVFPLASESNTDVTILPS